MTKTVEPNDSDLLCSLLDGDEAAFTTLYRRRQGSIYRFALQMSGSHVIAEDVTQEVFMVLIRGDARYDATLGSVHSFLLGVARNHVLRRLKSQRAMVSFPDDSEGEQLPETVTGEDPLAELTREETIDAVRRAVLTLPTHYREVVVLCELQEMSYAEAAAVLGCAVGTVRSRLHRARALLIEKLRPAEQEEVIETQTRSARCFA